MTDGTETIPSARPYPGSVAQHGRPQPANLADILERILDKGIIIAGDIRVNLLDIELLTIKIRLLVVSVDKAEEMGIDWWRHDPMLSSPLAKSLYGRAWGDDVRKKDSMGSWREPDELVLRNKCLLPVSTHIQAV